MGKPPEMRTWVPWSELVHQPRGTLDEFRTLLRRYPEEKKYLLEFEPSVTHYEMFE
jgi:hypothetical protein